MFTDHTCVTIHCDNGCEWDDDEHPSGLHFTSREEATEYVRQAGWLVTDRVLCPRCVAKAQCEATGHQWGEWRDQEHHGLRYRARLCTTCDDWDHDPPFAQLREQVRAVDDAERILTAAGRQHGGTDG